MFKDWPQTIVSANSDVVFAVLKLMSISVIILGRWEQMEDAVVTAITIMSFLLGRD